MKLVLGTAVMMLLVGTPSYARQEPDKDKPKEEPKKQEEPKKGEQPDRGRQEQQKPADKPKQEPDRQQQPQDRSKPAQQNDRTPQQQQDDRNRNAAAAKPAQQNDRTQQQQQDDRTRNNTTTRPAQQDRPQDQQRTQQTEHSDRGAANSGGGGRRVPDEQFRTSFGREHSFHVQRSNDRRFNYGGYYFQYSEAWPSDWDYDRDDVYIDYIDGNYYLINQHHPGVRLLVIIAD
jgi:outer membrane biosynthesis protein TonB